jgi:hypothetical protein
MDLVFFAQPLKTETKKASGFPASMRSLPKIYPIEKGLIEFTLSSEHIKNII